jgi:hypothetical protein
MCISSPSGVRLREPQRREALGYEVRGWTPKGAPTKETLGCGGRSPRLLRAFSSSRFE